MKNNYSRLLLPYVFQKIGWIILLFFLVLFALLIPIDVIFRLGIDGPFIKLIGTLLYASVPISMLFICFSKEKQEDEFILNLRYEAILISFYISVFLSVIGQLVFYCISLYGAGDNNFIFALLKQLIRPYFILFILYLIIFKIKLYVAKKELIND